MIHKFKTRKNIYSAKQLVNYILTDKGKILNPFEAPLVLQNINRLELDTIHKDFLENHTYANKRSNGNALLHEIVAISKEEHLFWKAIKGDDTGNLIGAPKLSHEVQTNITNNAFGYFGGTNELVFRARVK